MEFSLKQCVWEITLACPFNCRYCGSGGGKARENELTTKECLDVAEQLAQLGCRSYNFFVHGKMYQAPRCARTNNENCTTNIL